MLSVANFRLLMYLARRLQNDGPIPIAVSEIPVQDFDRNVGRLLRQLSRMNVMVENARTGSASIQPASRFQVRIDEEWLDSTDGRFGDFSCVTGIRGCVISRLIYEVASVWREYWPVHPWALEQVGSDAVGALYLLLSSEILYGDPDGVGAAQRLSARKALKAIGIDIQTIVDLDAIKRFFEKPEEWAPQAGSILESLDGLPLTRGTLRIYSILEVEQSTSVAFIVFWRDRG